MAVRRDDLHPAETMKIVAVVLAGGLSRRFGTDKLLARVEGREVIARVIDAVLRLTPEVYVSVADRDRWSTLRGAIGGLAKPIADRRELECAGPARGILSSLMDIDSESLLFVPGDSPWIDDRSLEGLISQSSGCDIGVPFRPSGTVEMLFQYHASRDGSLASLAEAAELRRERMRPSDALRCLATTAFVRVGGIANRPSAFSNANTPEDLGRPGTPAVGGGGTVRVEGEAKRLFWEAARLRVSGDYGGAAAVFERESSRYHAFGLEQVALHCLVDCEHCLRMAGSPSEEKAAAIAELRRRLEISRPPAGTG